jgi:hypothetical protein
MAKLSGSAGTFFGYSVAVAGNWIVVGVIYDDTQGIDAGAVYVFSNTSSSSLWTLMTQLLAADGGAGARFGFSVAISKDATQIVVGAYWDDFNTTTTDSGAAYLFWSTDTTTSTTTSTMEYTQMGKFVAVNRATSDFLGTSIAIENKIVVVGAEGDDEYTGSVYILDTGFSSPLPTMTTNSPTSIAPRPTNTTGSPFLLPLPTMTTNSPTSIAPRTPPAVHSRRHLQQ